MKILMVQIFILLNNSCYQFLKYIKYYVFTKYVPQNIVVEVIENKIIKTFRYLWWLAISKLLQIEIM